MLIAQELVMHALTVRLSDKTYQAAKRLAAQEGLSINRLIQQAIAEKAGRSVEGRLSAAYEIMGEDAEGADVEGFLAVQAEAMLDE
jgi:predicted transcriptional regulator